MFKFNESTVSIFLGALVLFSVIFLTVNYFKNRNTGTTVPAKQTETSVPQKGNEYTVAKGDTLWNIAEKAYGSGYNWVDIAEENGITNADSIEEGQVLSIPEVENKTATVSEFGELANEDSGEMIVQPETTKDTATSYTVVKGDNLWKIAVTAYGDGFRWVDIAKANKLANPRVIHAGNILVLPR